MFPDSLIYYALIEQLLYVQQGDHLRAWWITQGFWPRLEMYCENALHMSKGSRQSSRNCLGSSVQTGIREHMGALASLEDGA